jgi:flagellar biosynthesis protein FlhG
MTMVSQQTAQSRIITVGGGKGGVGKSIVALNLAAALAQDGYRVVIADMDLGSANQHILLGVRSPAAGLQALLDKSVDEAKSCLTETQVPNLRLLAGTSGVLGAANITGDQKTLLLRKLRALEADIIVVDVGAGVGYDMLDFFDLGVLKLIVTTPQVTALHDAYAFLKSAALRLFSHIAEEDIDAALLEPATLSTGGQKVVEKLAHLRETRPELAAKVFSELERFGACIVGNQVFKDADSLVFGAVARTIHDYLGLNVPVLGWLRTSAAVHESVNGRRPLVLDKTTKDSAAFHSLARKLLATLPAADLDLGIVEDVAIDEPSAA